MKRNRWTKEELQYIKDNAKDKSTKEMALYLDRTERAVRNRCGILGISLIKIKNKDIHSWTTDDEDFLRENYYKYTVQELSKIMGLKETVIRAKKWDMGLKNKYDKIKENGGKVYVRNRKNYLLFFDKKTGKLTPYHRIIFENYYGIKLNKEQQIHHIDGNKKNNDISNLFLCENVSHHRKVHDQLEKLSFDLIKKGIIKFDHELGKYVLNETNN